MAHFFTFRLSLPGAAGLLRLGVVQLLWLWASVSVYAATAPTKQPAVAIASAAKTSATIKISNGTGQGFGSHVLVTVRPNLAVRTTPADNTTYSANALYGWGQNLGTNNFVVFIGEVPGNTTFVVTGLQARTSYIVEAFGFNVDGTAPSPNYKTTSEPSSSKTLNTPDTYYWKFLSNNTSWNSALGWAPSRTTPTAWDELVVDGSYGGVSLRTGAAIVDVSSSQAVMGKLRFINSVAFTLDATNNSAANNVFQLAGNGDAGTPDFTIESGSRVTFSARSGGKHIKMQLAGGATALIAGQLKFQHPFPAAGAGEHRLLGGSGAIQFIDGGHMLVEAGTVGAPFGNSNDNKSSVVFKAGSMYEQVAGSDPFALASPSAVAQFQNNSWYHYREPVADATHLSLANRSLGNFIFNPGSGTAEVGGIGSLQVQNNLHIMSGVLRLTNQGDAYVMADLTTETGSTLEWRPVGAEREMQILGNLSLHGPVSFPAYNSRLHLKGLSLQYVNGATSALDLGQYTELRINNGQGVVLNRPVLVGRALNLLQGRVYTSTQGMLSLQAGAQLLGGNSNSYIDGPLARGMQAVAPAALGPQVSQSLLFPIGRNGIYRPLQIAVNKQLAATTMYTVEQMEKTPLLRTMNSQLQAVSGVRSFMVLPSPMPAAGEFEGSVSISFEAAGDFVGNPATLVVARSRQLPDNSWDAWENMGRQVQGPSDVTSTLLSEFGEFALGTTSQIDNPLPLTWGEFAATPANGRVQLTWQTLMEINTARFEVERSADGRTFNKLTQQTAAGSSTAVLNYQAWDEAPLAGLNYYRIRQVDLDGKYTYSDIRTVKGGRAEAAVFPNPARGELNFRAPEPEVRWRVLNGLGQELEHGQTAAASGKLGLHHLRAGVYYLELRTRKGVEVKRFVKE